MNNIAGILALITIVLLIVPAIAFIIWICSYNIFLGMFTGGIIMMVCVGSIADNY